MTHKPQIVRNAFGLSVQLEGYVQLQPCEYNEKSRNTPNGIENYLTGDIKKSYASQIIRIYRRYNNIRRLNIFTLITKNGRKCEKYRQNVA